ncbi:IS481 family transposase [Vulcanimicrobium alpinum]|uniref:IS481 family transposase n=3 Tax=Vulcanimicrobium alpinum TaxID=3016050 RepID=A0AAN1XS46_UNVUL|nr:IS481 family transposase [Vulcanimicrobium alpinum]
MIMHPQARTTPLIRREIVALVQAGEAVAAVARRFKISRPTVYKWLARFAQAGESGLRDRRPVAIRFPTRVRKAVERQIDRLRRTRRLLGWQIAEALSMARSTVIKVLKRLNIARLRDLEPARFTQRYEYRRPGELVHIDIKKIARFERVGHRIHGDRTKCSRRVGYDVIFVAVDDASRRTETRVYTREDATSAADFLRRLAILYARRGVRIERVMTDNGKVFSSNAFESMMRSIGARHIFTPPYTPRWNGKAERFIQTMLREWAYAVAYRTSDERRDALPAWLRYYNEDRRHTAINYPRLTLGRGP